MKLRRAFGKPFRLLFEAKMSHGTMRSLWPLLRDLLEKPKRRRCKCQILIETLRKKDNVLKNNRILQAIGVLYSTRNSFFRKVPLMSEICLCYLTQVCVNGDPLTLPSLFHSTSCDTIKTLGTLRRLI